MFDRIDRSNHSVNYPSTVNVNERRAPTDDSIRLLREMEEKARAQVLSVYAFEGNELRLSYVKAVPMSGIDRVESVVVFKLNDREYRVTLDATKANHLGRECGDMDGAVKEIHRVFSEAVADVLFRKLFNARDMARIFGEAP